MSDRPYSFQSNLVGALIFGSAVFFFLGGGYLLLSAATFVVGLFIPSWLFPGA